MKYDKQDQQGKAAFKGFLKSTTLTIQQRMPQIIVLRIIMHDACKQCCNYLLKVIC
jgi:hypothetical protein